MQKGYWARELQELKSTQATATIKCRNQTALNSSRRLVVSDRRSKEDRPSSKCGVGKVCGVWSQRQGSIVLKFGAAEPTLVEPGLRSNCFRRREPYSTKCEDDITSFKTDHQKPKIMCVPIQREPAVSYKSKGFPIVTFTNATNDRRSGDNHIANRKSVIFAKELVNE